ncbi:OLC1v1018532C1 [Oldenlandia corymbosa var. corymbosa]|uniref:OLC1v1018532C1 n=1 Tax=Oldenlandia corymbosa var. corymbosa TaxID=529605 RepID=A0AAV1EBT7_OLDCO|nr:OLC1v1018532C1 [Oldenlandia corymbosa var. corymbosa]
MAVVMPAASSASSKFSSSPPPSHCYGVRVIAEIGRYNDYSYISSSSRNIIKCKSIFLQSPLSSSLHSISCRSSSTSLLPLTHHNDGIQSLFQILPTDLRDILLCDPNQSQLLEVVLDLGKLPQACYAGDSGRQVLRNTQVTWQELEYAQNAIGTFGDDNRAGIAGTLHRISAIRSREGAVIGLTCRVGRAIQGHICMVRDLLDFGESILFIGRPGVGKTTVIREISRVLADELHKRVVIVDTNNEIGGEGDIPHPAIGDARRLQVYKPSVQHLVMSEAVENHMPEVIIVDEIGTEAEVNACCSIAQRGVMLIATAHGEVLENIVKNPILADMIGGVKSVTLGGHEARLRQSKKTILQRRAYPAFGFLIEIRERHYWVVHRTARSVDLFLSGRKPLVEIRRRDEDSNVIIERWRTES